MSVATITNRIAIGLVISSATLLAASTSFAQSRSVHTVHPVAFGYGHYHSSTVAEGFLRGKAAVIDSLGNFQVNAGEAAILREHARALDRENDLKQTEALQAQNQMFVDARIQARIDRVIRAEDGNKLLSVRRATTYRQAYQLSASELNMTTGDISWPVALQDAKFQEIRTRVDELFRQHVGYGEHRAATANEIARTVDTWSRSLRNDINSMPRENYLAAQKFLLGVKYSAASMVEST